MLPWVDAATARSGHPRRDRSASARTSSSPSARTASTGIRITSPFTSGRRRRSPRSATDAPALYYVTMPPGRMRAVVDTRRRAEPPGRRRDAFSGIADADAFGALAAAPTLVVEAGAFAVAQAGRASGVIASQLAGDALDLLSDERCRAPARYRALPARERRLARRRLHRAVRGPGIARTAAECAKPARPAALPVLRQPPDARGQRGARARRTAASNRACSAASAARFRSSPAFR